MISLFSVRKRIMWARPPRLCGASFFVLWLFAVQHLKSVRAVDRRWQRNPERPSMCFHNHRISGFGLQVPAFGNHNFFVSPVCSPRCKFEVGVRAPLRLCWRILRITTWRCCSTGEWSSAPLTRRTSGTNRQPIASRTVRGKNDRTSAPVCASLPAMLTSTAAIMPGIPAIHQMSVSSSGR
jgi:hypothetical protein